MGKPVSQSASRPRRPWLAKGIFLVAVLSPLATLPALEALALGSAGTPDLLDAKSSVAFPMGLHLLCLCIVSMVLLSLNDSRRALTGCGVYVLAIVIYSGCALVGGSLSERVRLRAAEGVAGRSAPLVAALRAYERDHGGAPGRLDDLVPQYLPAVPGTGMGACPEHRYEGPAGPGGDWALYVKLPASGVGFGMSCLECRSASQSSEGAPYSPVRLRGDWQYETGAYD